MLKDGSYSAWFRTQRGEGTGIVELSAGKVTGGDAFFAYAGHTSRMEIRSRLRSPRSGTRRGVFRFRHRQCRPDADRQILRDRDGVMQGTVKQIPA